MFKEVSLFFSSNSSTQEHIHSNPMLFAKQDGREGYLLLPLFSDPDLVWRQMASELWLTSLVSGSMKSSVGLIYNSQSLHRTAALVEVEICVNFYYCEWAGSSAPIFIALAQSWSCLSYSLYKPFLGYVYKLSQHRAFTHSGFYVDLGGCDYKWRF